MRYHIAQAKALSGVSSNQKDTAPGKTKDAFFQLEKEVKPEAISEVFPRRMRGLSSYDVLDSEAFTYAKKVEERLHRFDKRNRMR